LVKVSCNQVLKYVLSCGIDWFKSMMVEIWSCHQKSLTLNCPLKNFQANSDDHPLVFGGAGGGGGGGGGRGGGGSWGQGDRSLTQKAAAAAANQRGGQFRGHFSFKRPLLNNKQWNWRTLLSFLRKCMISIYGSFLFLCSLATTNYKVQTTT